MMTKQQSTAKRSMLGTKPADLHVTVKQKMPFIQKCHLSSNRMKTGIFFAMFIPLDSHLMLSAFSNQWNKLVNEAYLKLVQIKKKVF